MAGIDLELGDGALQLSIAGITDTSSRGLLSCHGIYLYHFINLIYFCCGIWGNDFFLFSLLEH